MRSKCVMCNKYSGKGNGSFFAVPKNEYLREQWVKICGVDFKKCAVICEEHFSPSSFINGPGDDCAKKRLLPTAVPSVALSLHDFEKHDSGSWTDNDTGMGHSATPTEFQKMPDIRRCVMRCKQSGKLFCFPKEPPRREHWLRLFGLRLDIKVPKVMYACERHFSSGMRCTRNLTRRAVPDLNLPFISLDSELPVSYTSAFVGSKAIEPLQESEVFLKLPPRVEELQDSADPIDTNANPIDGFDNFIEPYEDLTEEYADPIEENPETVEILSDEDMPHVARAAVNHIEPEKVEPPVAVQKRPMSQEIYCLKRKLLKWKMEVRKLRVEKWELMKKCNMDNGSEVCELPKSRDSGKISNPPLFDNKSTMILKNIGGCPDDRVCGVIKVTKDKVYNMHCFYCSEVYPIWSWTQFVTHIKENHNDSEQKQKNESFFGCNKITKNVIITKLQLNGTNVKVDDIVFQNEDDLSGFPGIDEMIEEVSDDEEAANEDLGLQTDIVGSDNLPLVSNTSVDDVPDNIEELNMDMLSISKTDPKIMLSFLELLKMYPILWQNRLKSMAVFDSAVAKVTEIVNSKWYPNITRNGMRETLIRIKQWYRRIAELDKAKKATGILENSNKLLFFFKCAEIENISNKIIISCELCESLFLDRGQLQKHKEMEHKSGEMAYKCSQCDVRFSIKSQLKTHERTHWNAQTYKKKLKKIFVCNLCAKGFYVEARYKRHIKKHKEEQIARANAGKSHLCDTCGKQFPTIREHQKHQLYHEPPKFHCEICPKRFYRPFTLNQHMKAHRDQRDFICEMCGKGFVRKASLIEHRFTHGPRRQHECKICGFHFTQLQNLHRHLKTAHLVLEGAVEDLYLKKKKRRYFCRFCNIEFKRLKGLRDHRIALHKTAVTKAMFERRAIVRIRESRRTSALLNV